MAGKAIAIIGSVDTGHAPFAPSVGVTGEELFKVNGVPVMCTGDVMAPHKAPDKPPHTGTVVGGSLITINGKKAAKVGDAVGCGSTLVTGDNKFKTT